MSQNFKSDANFQSYSYMQQFPTSNYQDQGRSFRSDSVKTFSNQHSIQNIPHPSTNQVDVNSNMQMRNFGNYNSCDQYPNSFRFLSQHPQAGNSYVHNPLNSNLFPNQNPQMNIGPNSSSFPSANQNPHLNIGPNSSPYSNKNSQMNNGPSSNPNSFSLPNQYPGMNICPIPNSFSSNQNPQMNIDPNSNPNSYPYSNKNPQTNMGPNSNPNSFPYSNQNPQIGQNSNMNSFPLPNQNPQMNMHPNSNSNSFPYSNQNPQANIGPNQNPNSFRFPNPYPQTNFGPNPNVDFPFRNQNPQVMNPACQRPLMDNALRYANKPTQSTFNTTHMGITQAFQPYSANCPQQIRSLAPPCIQNPRMTPSPMHCSENDWNKAQNQTSSGNVGDILNRENYQMVNKDSKVNTPETDQEWVRGWTNSVKERLDSEKKRKATKFQIKDVQRKLLRYATLVNDLQTSSNSFPFMESTEEEFATFKNNAEALKKEIIELRNYFEDDENSREIKRMLARRRRKRLVARKGKKEKAARRKQIKEEWKEKERRIDEKMKELREQESNKINEEKMKKEADAILREVRTKQDDARKMQQILQALTKLRSARIKKGEIHGYVSSPKADAFFEKLNGEFDSLLKDQLNLYNTEEQTLKVMMEESKTIYPHLKEKSLTKPKTEEVQKQIYEILFGRKGRDTNEFQSAFTAADESAEILVQRRYEWDKFLVPEDDFNGSSVPVHWVLPSESPQQDWKRFQES